MRKISIAERARQAERLVDEKTQSLPNGDETFILCLECDEVDGHARGCSVGEAQEWLDRLP